MKIAVVGSINMDQVVVADKIPKKGETIIGNDLYYIPGGKGANQAVAMARLLGDVEMYGLVGKDENGEKLLTNLNLENVDTTNIKKSNKNTGLAVITVAENDNSIVVIAGANNDVDIAYIKSVESNLLKNDIVVLQHEIPLETVAYVVDLFYKHHKKIVLNPAPAAKVSEEILSKVSYLTPNEHETKVIFDDENFESLVEKYQSKLIVTMGEKGVMYFDGQKTQTIPVRKTKVVDTTGAGDTLNGAFVIAISRNYQIDKALKFANIAAGLACEKLGAQSGMPNLKDVEREM